MTTTETPKRRGMNDLEADIANRIYKGIQAHATGTERGAQASAFKVGVSDIGYCAERTRRMLNHEEADHPDMLLAWIGTALGDALEDAITVEFPEAVKQATVELVLHGDKRDYRLPGHPDIILPEEGIVLDGKTAEGLQLARRIGANRQQQFQRHGYGKAAWEAGFFGARPLENVLVGNVWLDRSGRERCVHVQLEPFSDEVIFEMTHYLEELVAAFAEGREAEKEPAREVCETTCGYFKSCRAYDTDVTGIITDPEMLAAVQLYLDGKAAASLGDRYKKEAKGTLVGIAGSTGRHTVRWISVNGTEERAGHTRLDIREID